MLGEHSQVDLWAELHSSNEETSIELTDFKSVKIIINWERKGNKKIKLG